MTDQKLRAVEELIQRLYDETYKGTVRFGPVFASSDSDDDGDYIRVHVIYDSPTGSVDPTKTITLLGFIEERLEEELGITVPAVVSHVDRTEEREWRPEVFHLVGDR